MTADDITSLLAAARRGVVTDAVHRLLADYADAVDAKDIDAVTKLFVDGGRFDSPRGVHTGHADIAASFRVGWKQEPSEKRHFITNVAIGEEEAPGSPVEVRARFIVVGRGETRSILGWGRYDDTVEVSAGEARFTRKAVDLELSSDLSAGWALPGIETEVGDT